MYAYFSKATLENKQFSLDSKRRSEQSIHILNENKRCRLSCFSSYSFHLLQTAVTPTWFCAPCRMSQQACRTPADCSQFLYRVPVRTADRGPFFIPISALYMAESEPCHEPSRLYMADHHAKNPLRGYIFRFFTFRTAIYKRDIALFPSERSD